MADTYVLDEGENLVETRNVVSAKGERGPTPVTINSGTGVGNDLFGLHQRGRMSELIGVPDIEGLTKRKRRAGISCSRLKKVRPDVT